MNAKKAGSREGSPVVVNGRSSSPLSPAQERSASPARCTSTSPVNTAHSPVCSVSSSEMTSHRIHSTTTPIRPIPQIPHTVSKHILDRTTSPLSIDASHRDLILKKPLMTSPHHHLHPHPSSSHHHPNGLLVPAHHNNNNHKENNTPVLVPTRPSFMISDILGSSDKSSSRSPLASGGLNLSQRSETLDCSTHRRHSSHTDSSVSPGSDYYHTGEKRKAPDDDENDDSDLDVEESDCESSPDKGKHSVILMIFLNEIPLIPVARYFILNCSQIKLNCFHDFVQLS